MEIDLEKQFKEETGLNVWTPAEEGNEYYDNYYVEWLEKQLLIQRVSKSFNSEEELLQHLYYIMPFAIKPKSKHAKTLFVNPFTSNHAFEEVCKHLANKLYNAR